MKIKFSNLGSIKETELDLRPLTVIIGPNNWYWAWTIIEFANILKYQQVIPNRQKHN